VLRAHALYGELREPPEGQRGCGAFRSRDEKRFGRRRPHTVVARFTPDGYGRP